MKPTKNLKVQVCVRVCLYVHMRTQNDFKESTMVVEASKSKSSGQAAEMSGRS